MNVILFDLKDTKNDLKESIRTFANSINKTKLIFSCQVISLIVAAASAALMPYQASLPFVITLICFAIIITKLYKKTSADFLFFYVDGILLIPLTVYLFLH